MNKKFNCNFCNYSTDIKCNFEKHINTSKHIYNTTNEYDENESNYIKNKRNIRKVSIKIKKRSGESKFGNSFLGNIKIFRDLFKEILS